MFRNIWKNKYGKVQVEKDSIPVSDTVFFGYKFLGCVKVIKCCLTVCGKKRGSSSEEKESVLRHQILLVH